MLQLVWSWQPALYLFLGGMGAGAFIVAAVLYLLDQGRHAGIICASMWASVLCLGVGLLLLLSELITPARGLLMWQSFGNFTSWMTYGAWGAFLAIIVFGVSALLAVGKVSVGLANAWASHASKKSVSAAAARASFAAKTVAVRKVLCAIGILLGAFVAVYTGMLLMTAPGVPLWNTPLLPCLFTVSAFDTGVALVEIVAVVASRKEKLAHRARLLLEALVVVLVVLECFVLGVFLAVMVGGDLGSAVGATAAESAELLVSGGLAPYFWGMVVVCGLAVPLLMATAGIVLRKKKDVNAFMAIGAIGALVGGCELRFLILAAGLHADVVAETVMGMIM